MKNKDTFRIGKVTIILTLFLTYGAIELARGELEAPNADPKDDSVLAESNDTASTEMDKSVSATPNELGQEDRTCCSVCNSAFDTVSICSNGCDQSC
jgi:hypothetical protein